MIRALVVTCAVAVMACGHVVNIGGVCEKREDCAAGQECMQSGPGGFCSKTCAVEGSTIDCPGGTVCTYFGGTALVCSTYCNVGEDCRINYQCGDLRGSVTGQGLKACQPDLVKR